MLSLKEFEKFSLSESKSLVGGTAWGAQLIETDTGQYYLNWDDEGNFWITGPEVQPQGEK